MSKTILVTGAAGFIGFHLAGEFVARGLHVIGIDNLNDYYDVALKELRLARLLASPLFRFERLDLVDHAALAALMQAERPSAVVHLAAQAGVRYSIENPRAYADANLDGFLGVLEACRAAPPEHLVYASSSSVYGTNRKVPFSEEDPVDQPISLYAASKRANELMARTYAHLYRLPATGLRFFTVYGPYGRPDMAYFSFTKAIMERRPIRLFNEGRALRDFTFVDDIVEGIVALIDEPPSAGGASPLDSGGAPHAIYNIGNNRPVELEHFVDTLEAAIGRKAVREYVPAQAGDVPATFADISRISAVTGFQPKTEIETGLRRFVDWYRGYRDGVAEPSRISSMKPASVSRREFSQRSEPS